VVGDGSNDATALATAPVSVALASGTDLAWAAADATLYHEDLRVLPWSLALARDAVRTIRRNLAVALAYNLIGVSLAAAGWLHPVVAALLMVASSIWVAASALRVGRGRLDCDCEPSPGRQLGWRAAVHAVSIALQGVILALLVGAAPGPAIATGAAFAVLGIVLAGWWHGRDTLPHHLDMTVGMLTFGNLGMVAGWWADAGFLPLTSAGCDCADVTWRTALVWPWMWIGMVAAGTIAMAWLGRQPCADPWAMYGGGNIGMLTGMVTGGWLAGWLPITSAPAAVAAAYGGMTVGMLAGMAAGVMTVQVVRWCFVARLVVAGVR
jgi:hypothetical protein